MLSEALGEAQIQLYTLKWVLNVEPHPVDGEEEFDEGFDSGDCCSCYYHLISYGYF